MRIAVLAWGSLLWSPRELKIKNQDWHSDGPYLPIEFSRIASDGRLTLVIDPAFDEVQTYWQIMDCDNLKEARENLQLREGADKIEEIGFVESNIQTFQIREDILFLKEKIRKWATLKKLDAAIWTDLRPKFIEKTGEEFNEVSAIKYLNSLQGETFSSAKEYLLMTPPNTRTRLRYSLEKCVNEKSP